MKPNQATVQRDLVSEFQLMRLALQSMEAKVAYWLGHPEIRKIIEQEHAVEEE